MSKEHITVKEAFKIIDNDFDGLIGKKDLTTFLNKVLGIKLHILTQERINRLFKLLDYHNRKNIQLLDFEKALKHHVSGGKAFSARARRH